MNNNETTLLVVTTVFILCCGTFSGCGAAVVLDCKHVGVVEEDLMIVGHELNVIEQSTESNRSCIQAYVFDSNVEDEECWRQLVTTSGTENVGGGEGEELSTFDESFLSEFRSLVTNHNRVIDEIEEYFTSVIEKGNYKNFGEMNKRRVREFMASLSFVDEQVREIQSDLRRMTGELPNGEWGYCNNSNKGRAEIYVLKRKKEVFYAWEPLRGD
jgi:hypothetical protein